MKIISAGGPAREHQFKTFFRISLTVPKMSPIPIFIRCQLHPVTAQNQKNVGSQSAARRTPYLVNQSESSTKNPKIHQLIRIEQEIPIKLRQQSRIEYYVNPDVSQSESSTTSAVTSANQNPVLRQPKALARVEDSSRFSARNGLL